MSDKCMLAQVSGPIIGSESETHTTFCSDKNLPEWCHKTAPLAGSCEQQVGQDNIEYWYRTECLTEVRATDRVWQCIAMSQSNRFNFCEQDSRAGPTGSQAFGKGVRWCGSFRKYHLAELCFFLDCYKDLCRDCSNNSFLGDFVIKMGQK